MQYSFYPDVTPHVLFVLITNSTADVYVFVDLAGLPPLAPPPFDLKMPPSGLKLVKLGKAVMVCGLLPGLLPVSSSLVVLV